MGRDLRILLALGLLFAPFAARAAYVPGNDVVSPIAYGCYGDGVHDDSACFAAAVAASNGKILHLGNYKYKITTPPANINYPVHIVGTLPGYDSTFPNDVSEIIAGATNMSIFNLVGGASGSILENFAMKMGAAGTNTSGVAVTVGSTSQVVVSNLWIDHPCVGVDVNGNTNTLQGLLITKVGGSGCGGVRVGFQTTNAGTVDVSIMNTTVAGDQGNVADFALNVKDAGGLAIYNFNGLYTNQGTSIAPAANQQVIWLFANNSALGDTTVNQALIINTTAASAVVKGLNFVGTWSASSTSGDGVQVANTGGGTVTDVYFSGHRSYNNFLNGFTVFSGVTNVSIDGSHVCGFGVNGIELKSTVSQVRIRDSEIAPNCVGLSGSGTVGILLDGSNNKLVLVGNDLSGDTTPVSGTPVTDTVIGPNLGLNNASASVASGTTINLNTVSPVWTISGTTTTTTINGFWNGRTVTFLPSGAVPFNTGGNICNALTATVNVPVLATYSGSCWYLK